MRLLLVNPNATAAITDAMAGEARLACSPDTEVVAVTAAFGTLYIENRVEVAIASHALVETLAEHAGGCDAVVVSAFGDPGLAAAKELLDVPVVGIAEAAMHVACMVAGRYSIVCMTPRLRTWYEEVAREHDMDARLASVRSVAAPPADVTRARDQLAGAVGEQALRAVESDGAEAIVVGGGPLAGVAGIIAPDLPVPVIDGVHAGVRVAEALAGLGLRAPSVGRYATPGPKQTRGLGAALTARLEGASVETKK